MNTRALVGDPIGHWEGDTLLVDTTNFTDQTAHRGVPNDRLHMIERFTRTSSEDRRYQITIDTPNMFSRPWTMEMIQRVLLVQPAIRGGGIGRAG